MMKPQTTKRRIRRVFSMHSTASLRRELEDPKTNRAMKNAIWAELMRRREARSRQAREKARLG
jgi:hypothetical protein